MNAGAYGGEMKDVLTTGSAAKVYHKAAVLIADGCAAVAIAAQAALVDQRSRKSTRRALEGAAGAGLIQRLLFHTLGHQFIHFCTDVRCVSGLQMELCREDAAAVLFKNAVAIAEIQLCGRHFSDPTKNYQRTGLENEYYDILGVSIPSTSIPVSPGRNLAVVLETAAINNRQKKMGYNAARELLIRLGLDDKMD